LPLGSPSPIFVPKTFISIHNDIKCLACMQLKDFGQESGRAGIGCLTYPQYRPGHLNAPAPALMPRKDIGHEKIYRPQDYGFPHPSLDSGDL
jgi:hypothetical protein